MRHALLAATAVATSLLAAVPAVAGLTGSVTIAGNATDLSGLSNTPTANRLSVGSDLFYDATSGDFFGIADRGPGGGTLSFETRLHRFSLDVSPSGALSNFTLKETILLKDQSGNAFNGLNPTLLNGSPATLGNSYDPEGLVVSKTGTFFVADEYGPTVREFAADGTLIRTLNTPANILPTQSGGTPNFTDGRPTITSGRQDNRGFEGLAISPDGKTLTAVLQDPLVTEGAQADGRRSRNVRVVQFDVATGDAVKQFIYQLEPIATLNQGLPSADQFSATNQGRSIGLSGIVALDDNRFLVIERDNRGIGPDNLVGNGTTQPPTLKSVFEIDTSNATDVSNIPLVGTSTLPANVTPVTKTKRLDILSELTINGQIVPEKVEGLTIGPNGYLIVATDNDFSVTQFPNGSQFDICRSPGGSVSQVAVGAACPAGTELIPTIVYAFDIPEPGSLALLAGAIAGLGLAARRRRA